MTRARRRRLTTGLAVGTGLITTAMAGTAGAVRPATFAPTVIADPTLLARDGLEFQADPAPHLAQVAALKGLRPQAGLPVEGTLRSTPSGDLLLMGEGGWVYRGRTTGSLRRMGWSAVFDPWMGTQVISASDGGLVAARPASEGGELIGFGPTLAPRWQASPVWATGGLRAQGPIAAAPFDVLYAVGPTPSVLDARTGQVIATLQNAPADLRDPVVAPDGTLRVVGMGGGAGPVTLYAYGQDGRQLWATQVAPGTAPLYAGASAPSVGPGGTTYITSWVSAGGSTSRGQLRAIGADGFVRWTASTGRAAARPAVDARGFVWTVTSRGEAIAADGHGAVVFRRRVGSAGQTGRVAATGDGVLVEYAATAARLVAKRAPSTRPSLHVNVVPRSIRLVTAPTVCVAPPSGRPRTCLYPIGTPGFVTVRAPVDGLVRLEVRRAGASAVVLRQGPVRVLSGMNRIRLDLNGGACATGACALTPGRYRVSLRVPTATGYSRLITQEFRLRTG